MRGYEIMLILPPEADDKVIGGVSDRIASTLGATSGEVTKIDRWGRRRLAYPIKRFGEGFYLVVNCKAEPAALKELDRVLALADDVLRFKVVVLPDARRPRGGARLQNFPSPEPAPSAGGQTG